MHSLWMITATNVFIIFLMLGIPVLLLALGISLGLRLAPGKSTGTSPLDNKSNRNVYLALGVFLIALLLFLSFNIALPPGRAPLPFLLPMLLILVVQLAFWVLMIAGAVWLVLWLARRMGVVGPHAKTRSTF